MGAYRRKTYKRDDFPEYEQERLSILKSYQILDTDQEECFDSIVEMIQESFNVPIALITIIDENRLWFKAKAGVNISEIPRKSSICAYTVLYDNVTIIHDLKDDIRFSGSPMLGPPYNLRFYAGAPIIVEGGYKLGTVCLLGHEARHDFTGLDAIKLAEYAAIVSDLIIMRRNAVVEKSKNHAKSEFIHELSHEFKTPLNVITGVSKILMDSKDIPVEKNRLIEVMHSSAEALSELVNTLNDLELIENQRLKLVNEWFDLHSVVQDVSNSLSVLITDKALEFKEDYEEIKGLNYYGDKLRLKQVLINLIANAVKYTDKGSIELKAYNYSPSLEGDDYVEFQVKDTGIGISVEDQGRIFDRFCRDEKRVYHREGAGLGLTIAKKIIDEMGGVIGFESKPDKGSCFWVRLPMKSTDNARE